MPLRTTTLYTILNFTASHVTRLSSFTILGEGVIIRLHHHKPTLSLQWRHDERHGIANHQPHNCLLNRLLRHRSEKTSKLRVSGLCEGNSPVTGEFPAQKANHAEIFSIQWRHHVTLAATDREPSLHWRIFSINLDHLFNLLFSWRQRVLNYLISLVVVDVDFKINNTLIKKKNFHKSCR